MVIIIKPSEIAHNLIDSAAVYNDFFLNKEANQIIGTHFLTNSEPDKAYPIFWISAKVDTLIL